MTVPELLDTIRTHLAQFELPELCSVTVTASTRALQVSGQLACQEAPEIAAALLAWADTLTDLAGQAWRVPDGSSVHLSITGRLPCGTSVQVYSGVPFHPHGVGADLDPGDKQPLLLGALRHLASPAEVSR